MEAFGPKNGIMHGGGGSDVRRRIKRASIRASKSQTVTYSWVPCICFYLLLIMCGSALLGQANALSGSSPESGENLQVVGGGEFLILGSAPVCDTSFGCGSYFKYRTGSNSSSCLLKMPCDTFEDPEHQMMIGSVVEWGTSSRNDADGKASDTIATTFVLLHSIACNADGGEGSTAEFPTSSFSLCQFSCLATERWQGGCSAFGFDVQTKRCTLMAECSSMTDASPDFATGVRVVPIGPDVEALDAVDGGGPSAAAGPAYSQGEMTASVTSNSHKADWQQSSTNHYHVPSGNSAKKVESGDITADRVQTTHPSPPIESPDETSLANDPPTSAASSSLPNVNSGFSETQSLQTGFKTHRGLACLDDHREIAAIDSAPGCQELCILRTWCNGFSFNTRRKRCFLKEACTEWEENEENMSGTRLSIPRADESASEAEDWSSSESEPSESIRRPHDGETEQQSLEQLMQGTACQDPHDEISSVPSPEQCKEACQERSWCRAFSFNTEKHRCYMKKSCSKKRSNPDNVSGMVLRVQNNESPANVEASGSSRDLPKLDEVPETEDPEFKSLDNTACEDLTLETLNYPDVTACQEVCRGRAWCGAFSFNTRSNRCYLKLSCKATAPHRENESGIRSAEWSSGSGGFGPLMQNIECRGPSYRDAQLDVDPGVALAACMTACTKADWCLAFTFNARSSKCYLKRWCGDQGDENGALSGQKPQDGDKTLQYHAGFWDKRAENNCQDGVSESVQTLEETPYNGQLYQMPGDWGIHALLRPSSQNEAWHNHASHMLLLPGGDILMAWFWGQEGRDGVAIVVSRLDLGASCWSDLQVVSVEEGRSAQNPTLMHDGSKVVLLHTSQAAGKGQGTSKVYVLTSEDQGRTWSQPTSIMGGEKGAFVRNSPLPSLTNPSEQILPMYYTPDGLGNSRSQYAAVKRSSSPADTWSEPVKISQPGQRLAQPTIARLSDGSILAILRDRNAKKAYRSVSDDDGHSWSKPVPLKVPNSNKAVTLLPLESGKVLLLFTNSDNKRKQSPMSLAMSNDGGWTFPFVRDLQGKFDDFRGVEFSYGSMIWSPYNCAGRTASDGGSGSLHISYTYSEGRRRTGIRYICIADPETWVVGGPKTKGAFDGD